MKNMEVWEDIEKSRYFALDICSGATFACDRFGQTPTSFTPYCSGFSKSLISRIKTPENNYKIQPKKFDGYFQCPRPALEIQYKSRVRLQDNISTLPRPVNYLQFSSIYDKSISPPTAKTPSPRKIGKPASKTLTLEDLKLQLLPPITQDVKTARQMNEDLEYDKKNNRSFKKKLEKPERRKLKGYFMTHIPSSTDLFIKEKEVISKTNPNSIFKQKKFEELDRKYLEKRREQKVLKNKLIILSK